jgi:hypothetical protein
MRYCNHCHRLTTGEPLFCNFCGRTYGLKICPYRHPNPRNAEICSQCGSRDLSTPHPRLPLWLTPLSALLSLIPGVLLFCLSVIFLLGFVRILLTNQQLLFQFMLIGLFIALLWWLYMQLPRFIRGLIGRLFRRRQKDEHEH